MPLDYEHEAEHYDRTRGGLPRARAAADAVSSLLPPDIATVIDLGGGTGLISALLVERGLHVAVVDQSAAMLARAAARVPGGVVRGGAGALPIASSSTDAVICVWLLHLLRPEVATAAIHEAARVLGPGGVFITTVDKAAAHGDTTRRPSDGREVVTATAIAAGLSPSGESQFVGVGQDGDPVFSLLSFTKQRGHDR